MLLITLFLGSNDGEKASTSLHSESEVKTERMQLKYFILLLLLEGFDGRLCWRLDFVRER